MSLWQAILELKEAILSSCSSRLGAPGNLSLSFDSHAIGIDLIKT